MRVTVSLPCPDFKRWKAISTPLAPAPTIAILFCSGSMAYPEKVALVLFEER
jgi:hypothetical protein